MRVLITGSTGFIGKNFSEKFKGKLFCPDRTQLNLLNKSMVHTYIKLNKIDVIIDCATWNFYTDKDKLKTIQYNLQMFLNITDCANMVKKIIYFGSGAEFDRENWKYNMAEDYFGINIPQDDYGFSKYVMNKYIDKYNNVYNLRLFGLYGEHELPYRFISYCFDCAINNKTINIKQNRRMDYMHIDDLINITNKFVKIDNWKYKTYNVCCGEKIELYILALQIISICGSSSKIKTNQDDFSREYTGDNSRLLKEIKGYKFIKLDDGLRREYERIKNSKRHS